jgi:transposase-like protein
MEVRMIGLLGVHPPAGDGAGIKLLESLPAPPASALAGAVIRCDCQREIHAVIQWYGDMRAIRPAFAVILVTDHRFGATLASCPHPVRAVVRPSDLVAGGLPRVALDQLRAASVEGRVLDRLVLQFGGALLEHMPLVRGLVAHAVRGGTVSAAARDLGVSVDTVRRRLAVAGVRPSDFMRAARVLAYEKRRAQGASARIALAACGWTDAEQLRRVRRRNELRQIGGADAA